MLPPSLNGQYWHLFNQNLKYIVEIPPQQDEKSKDFHLFYL